MSRAAADSPLWTWPATEAFRQSAGFGEFIRHRKFLESRVSWPQADWVCDEDGRCIVDFVGRFEELGAALETVAARLGLPSGVLGVHDGSESDRPLAECFGGEDDDRYVHDLNRRDLERFGYDPALRP